MPTKRNLIPRLFVAAFCLLMATLDCGAAVTVTARFGWGDRFRPERWTPAYVTARADAPTPAVVEWYVPRPGRAAMVIRQDVTLNAAAETFPAYLPVGPDPAAIHVTVRDAATGRTLGAWPQRPPSPTAYDAAQVRAPLFVGTSGESPSLRWVDRQTYAVAYLPPLDLPRRAVGYDGLDVLVLDRPDLNAMEPAQARAVAAWVRSGGRLVVWTGINPVPAGSPLADLMPGLVIDFATRRVGAADVPFVRLAGVAEDALVTTVRRGEGEVVFLHAPPDALRDAGVTFLPDTPRPALDAPPLPKPAPPNGGGRPGWLLAALAVAAVVGPVDWLVQRRTRRSGLPWVTLPGWVVLLGLLALYLPAGDDRRGPLSVDVRAHGDAATTAVVYDGEQSAADAHANADALTAVGPTYWKTAAATRTDGPIRDVSARQSDAGMPLPTARPLVAEAVALPD